MINKLSLPRFTKIVINMGLKEAITDKKILEVMATQLALISGQKPVVTKARKAIAAFKLRMGDKIGLKVTLRDKRMHDFLTKLIAVVLPRVRDFRGVSLKAFDVNGNYTLGISELTIFPEVDFSTIDREGALAGKIKGMEITIVNTAKNKEEGRKLLEEIGMPFSHQ